MNETALRDLIDNATLFAKCYSRLVEALRAEGVPEAQAREDARLCALMAAFAPEQGGWRR